MRDAARIGAVVLAAGRGTRFGSTKQLALIGGRPLVCVTAESILGSGLADVVVVVGHDAARVREALDDMPVRVVVNDRFAEGMATSIGAGIAALDADVAAALVVLGDQPVRAGVVAQLIERWRAGDPVIVAPVYAGARGNPVLFDAALFPDLMRLSGDRGARDLLEAAPERVTLVDFDYATPIDVDRMADIGALGSDS